MKWYQQTWAKIVISILILIIGSVVFFLFLVIRQAAKLNSGDFSVLPAFDSAQQQNVQSRDQYDLSLPNQRVISLVEDTNSPMSGNSEAKLTVVEFADYQCGYCRQLHPIIRRLSAEYQDRVRFIYRDYPVLGDDSYVFALAARCAHDQNKFFAFHDKIYMNQVSREEILAMSETIGLNTQQMEQCINSKKYDAQIQKDLNDGIAAGASGTPTLYINGYIIPGAPTYDIFKRILDTTLKNL